MSPKRPLTVLIVYAGNVFWSMGEGKGTPSFIRTVQALAERGHEVHVCLPDEVDGSKPQTSVAGDGTPPDTYHGARLHRSTPSGRILPRATLPFPLRVWERWRCWRRFQSWIRPAALEVARQHPPDIVLGLGLFEAPAARAIAQELGVPNVSRFFGVWSRLDKPIHYRANFPEIVAFRTPADAMLITNDGSPGDRVARREKFPPERMFYIRNGVNFDRFHPGPPNPEVRERLEMRPDQPLIMTISRISKEKLLHRALEAFVDVHTQRSDAVLALVGDGDDRLRLEALAQEMGIGDSVRFPGALLQQEVPDWYRSADLMLSLLDRTNTANPCFEAMACGAVYVALETITTRDLITDHVNGIVVPREELGQLGTRLIELIDQPELRRQIGTAAAVEIKKRLVTPEERLAFEVDLYEAVAHGLPWPTRKLG